VCLSSLPDTKRLELLQQIIKFFVQVDHFSFSPTDYYPSSSSSSIESKTKYNIARGLFISSHHVRPSWAATPLELLAQSPSPKCLHYFLENFTFEPWEVVRAAFRAVAFSQQESVEAILRYVFTPTPLSEILMLPTPPAVAQELQTYANDVVTTCLSSSRGRPLARILLRAFVDPVPKSNYELSGLDLQQMLCRAAGFQQTEAVGCATLLLEFQADPNLETRSKQRETPMDEAIRSFNYPLISLLIEYGADFSRVPVARHTEMANAVAAGLDKVRAKMEVIVESTPLKEIWLASIIIEYVYGKALAPLNSQ
jgi:hypothetical protein